MTCNAADFGSSRYKAGQQQAMDGNGEWKRNNNTSIECRKAYLAETISKVGCQFFTLNNLLRKTSISIYWSHKSSSGVSDGVRETRPMNVLKEEEKERCTGIFLFKFHILFYFVTHLKLKTGVN